MPSKIDQTAMDELLDALIQRAADKDRNMNNS
jgi:hypothetical protein